MPCYNCDYKIFTISPPLSAGPSRPNSLFYDESPENMGRGAGVNGSISGGGGGGSSGGGGANLFRDSITSTSLLLETCDPDCISWAHANSSGCRVTVKDTLVNLTIPEGSLAKTEEVFCAILTDEKDRPHLAGEFVMNLFKRAAIVQRQ